MIKEITLSVPKYVKKFIISEPDYDHLADGIIKVPRLTEMGHLIHGFSRTINYTQKFTEVEVKKKFAPITLRYTCKKKGFDVPVQRYTALAAFLNEQFRASLIREVTMLHRIHCEDDYSWMVRSFLDHRGVIVDDAQEKDMEWEAAKKIYRDHLSRIQVKNTKNCKLSQPSLSGLERVCRV
ncbi:hypothetical protein Dfri01_39170 [Dyadobacter frigoris]|uniref:hypothetical protein n=1 Tax=Dyadobacter frigoris TaxID=2576211 RepID=UPI0024A57A0F|nr:hypothetical protein [Dyadobacter frigoris]GLU54456.1 hypothetical protein Dfri01_39170 [Dyadobacter frigoris]